MRESSAPLGTVAAQRDEQRRGERNQLEHEYPDHHLERVLAEAVARGRDDHDADQHQADQRRQHREPGNQRRGTDVQLLQQRAAVGGQVGRGRQRKHQHQRADPHHVPPARRPLHAGPPGGTDRALQ